MAGLPAPQQLTYYRETASGEAARHHIGGEVRRELKRAIDSYWAGLTSQDELKQTSLVVVDVVSGRNIWCNDLTASLKTP